jgi:hypothetical protein
MLPFATSPAVPLGQATACFMSARFHFCAYLAQMVLDATGVGEVMYDLLRGSIQHLVPVTITSSGSATLHNGRHHVPKEQLAQVLSVVLEGEKPHSSPPPAVGAGARR